MATFNELRRDYDGAALDERSLRENPYQQFAQWFDDALAAQQIDVNAMLLATVDVHGAPDARVVLLKSFDDNGFVFYTDYTSNKGEHIKHCPHVALVFYWSTSNRQIRIKGTARPLPRHLSAAYFHTRPRQSQLAACVAQQSTVVHNRAVLEARYSELEQQWANVEVACPERWGGYCVVPREFEFFQGRPHRLHDRLRYQWIAERWEIERLAP